MTYKHLVKKTHILTVINSKKVEENEYMLVIASRGPLSKRKIFTLFVHRERVKENVWNIFIRVVRLFSPILKIRILLVVYCKKSMAVDNIWN